MPILSSENLLQPTLPEPYGRVLDLMAELAELRQGPSESLAERQATAREHYALLIREASQLEEPCPENLKNGSPTFERWFAEAVLLWTRLGKVGSCALVDTVGSKTLSKFPVDLPFDAACIARVVAATRRAFGFSEEVFERISAKVDHLASNLVVKNHISQALANYLKEADRLSPSGRVALMQAFYGDIPFSPGDIDWVITKTSIFPCVPRKGTRLLVDDWDERPPHVKDALVAFMKRLRQANKANTDRFPSFGLFEPDALSPELVLVLCEGAPVPEKVVLETLKTMVMVLPTHHIDQYLVHDVWGHTWQEALSEFEWEYARVGALDAALTPDTGPEFGGEVGCLLEAFQVVEGRVQLHEAKLLEVAEADVRGRLQVAASVALSELLADYMESKFARAEPGSALTTSSLIDVPHLKLDLSVGDLTTQVVRLGKPYRALAVDAGVREQFGAALRERGLPSAGLSEAVAAAGSLIWQRLGVAFDESLHSVPVASATGSERSIQSSALRRMLLEFLLNAEALERALDRADQVDLGDPKTCPDLFVLAMAHLYEQDRQQNLWHMDQVMRREFVAACDRVRDAFE